MAKTRTDEEALAQIRRQQEEQAAELAELREQLRRDRPPTARETSEKLERGLADLPLVGPNARQEGDGDGS